MGKKTKDKKAEPMLISHNTVLTNNKISETRVLDQLSRAPDPKDKGKSGYPHEYLNHESLIPKRPNSASTSYYEYPVTQKGGDYNFASKPKEEPGPYRGITNQDKTYKGTICHEGNKDTGNANHGKFHLCKPEEPKGYGR
ncbi:hypothetical protein F5B20DRAFT_578851 [Whalleya microplaca]|nr:hypothetical protein F5B20DRAFT_578851 [Whalleya microplaca]